MSSARHAVYPRGVCVRCGRGGGCLCPQPVLLVVCCLAFLVLRVFLVRARCCIVTCICIYCTSNLGPYCTSSCILPVRLCHYRALAPWHRKQPSPRIGVRSTIRHVTLAVLSRCSTSSSVSNSTGVGADVLPYSLSGYETINSNRRAFHGDVTGVSLQCSLPAHVRLSDSDI